METNQQILSNYQSLYVSRLIILVETGPQTNNYRQVILNKDQFLIVSNALSEAFGLMAGLPNAIPFQVSDKDIIRLPIEIRDFVSPRLS